MKQNSTKVRIAIFGIGMHFQETYTSALRRPEICDMVTISWVTDLAEKKDLALKRCYEAGQEPKFVGVRNFQGTRLPDDIEEKLDTQFANSPVDAVLVSTTPEQHRAYAAWAVSKGLDVLLDKPITSRSRAAFEKAQAMGILEDWESLEKMSQSQGTMLMINSHRRFHPAYQKVGELLEEIADQYGFGVTSISSFNSDGQWRFPSELRDIDYHGFNMGNGVLSHFGYHYLDLASTWYRKGTPSERRANKADVISSFSLARNYAKQITAADARRVLTQNKQSTPDPDDRSTIESIRNFGEVDSFNSIELYKDSVMCAHISLQMLHSGFSQRAWTEPADNLYKENGRVRWENHLIQQGPLHAIEIRSFQAVQPSHGDPNKGLPRWELGGSDQLEINIFRNKLIGGPPLQTIHVQDLLDEIPKHDVVHEDVKAKTFYLFASLVAVRQDRFETFKVSNTWRRYVQRMATADSQELSLISSHQPTVAFMAGAYASYAQRVNNPSLKERVEVDLRW